MRTAAPALLALVVAAFAGGARAEPPVWRVKGGAAEITVVAAWHMGLPPAAWRSRRLDALFASADEIWVEGETVAGAPPRPGDLVETARLRSLGFDPAFGVEAVAFRLKKRDASVRALQTRRELDALFDRIPAAERRLREQALRAPPGPLIDAYRAWERGELKPLERQLAATRAGQPVFWRRVVAERNRLAAGAIAERAKRPGRVVVILGAAHVLGEDGAPALLARRGLKVERLIPSP